MSGITPEQSVVAIKPADIVKVYADTEEGSVVIYSDRYSERDEVELVLRVEDVPNLILALQSVAAFVLQRKAEGNAL